MPGLRLNHKMHETRSKTALTSDVLIIIKTVQRRENGMQVETVRIIKTIVLGSIALFAQMQNQYPKESEIR